MENEEHEGHVPETLAVRLWGPAGRQTARLPVALVAAEIGNGGLFLLACLIAHWHKAGTALVWPGVERLCRWRYGGDPTPVRLCRVQAEIEGLVGEGWTAVRQRGDAGATGYDMHVMQRKLRAVAGTDAPPEPTAHWSDENPEGTTTGPPHRFGEFWPGVGGGWVDYPVVLLERGAALGLAIEDHRPMMAVLSLAHPADTPAISETWTIRTSISELSRRTGTSSAQMRRALRRLATRALAENRFDAPQPVEFVARDTVVIRLWGLRGNLRELLGLADDGIERPSETAPLDAPPVQSPSDGPPLDALDPVDLRALFTLRRTPGYPTNDAKDAAMIVDLRTRFPDIHLTLEANLFAGHYNSKRRRWAQLPAKFVQWVERQALADAGRLEMGMGEDSYGYDEDEMEEESPDYDDADVPPDETMWVPPPSERVGDLDVAWGGVARFGDAKRTSIPGPEDWDALDPFCDPPGGAFPEEIEDLDALDPFGERSDDGSQHPTQAVADQEVDRHELASDAPGREAPTPNEPACDANSPAEAHPRQRRRGERRAPAPGRVLTLPW